jgi:hypothetical protein
MGKRSSKREQIEWWHVIRRRGSALYSVSMNKVDLPPPNTPVVQELLQGRMPSTGLVPGSPSEPGYHSAARHLPGADRAKPHR